MAIMPESMAPRVRPYEPPETINDDPKEREFVAQYLIDLNAGAAAVRAGYGRQQAVKLMARPRIKHAIEQALAWRAVQHDLTTERIWEKLALIINGDRRELFNDDGSLKAPTQLTKEQAMLVEGVKTRRIVELDRNGEMQQAEIQEVKLVGMLPALNLAMKHKGMLVERVEHNVTLSLVEELDAARQRVVAAALQGQPVTVPPEITRGEAIDVEFEEVPRIPTAAEMGL